MKKKKQGSGSAGIAKAQVAPSNTPISLATLRQDLGAAEEDLRRRRFRGVTEEELVQAGTQIDSQSILDDVPRFVGSARAILAGLSGAQREKVKLPPGMLALLVDEADLLRVLKADFERAQVEEGSDKAQKGAEAQRVRRQGIALRDLICDGLRNALTGSRLAALESVIGTAETHEKLALGMEGVATVIESILQQGDADEKLDLADWRVGAESAAELRALATQVRSAGEILARPEKRVTQRQLDMQDGRVLLLIEQTLRAFRSAHRMDRSILLPELQKIAWMFEVRSGRKPRPTEPEPTPPQPPASVLSGAATDPRWRARSGGPTGVGRSRLGGKGAHDTEAEGGGPVHSTPLREAGWRGRYPGSCAPPLHGTHEVPVQIPLPDRSRPGDPPEAPWGRFAPHP
jgi:hypothetical protein